MTESNAVQMKHAECLSMTGFAQARGEVNGLTLRLTLKSVNHRFLDVKLRMPEGFDVFEMQLRKILREKIHRGHVELQVAIEQQTTAAVHVNQVLVKAYLRAAEALRQETRAAADVDVVALLRLPGVIAGLAPADQESWGQLGVALESCLREALAKLDEMRRVEGHQLLADLRARLANIETQCDKIRGLEATLRPAFARRLESRLKDLLGGIALEPARLAQEAALLAERSDISEELERLRSHVQQFVKLLDAAGEVGKKLDFLLQEMHREANTILSKTPGAGTEALDITGLALEIKSEIEKLREQVQNIE